MTNGHTYSKTKGGWHTIGDKKYYFRSSWEVTYAYYLQFLKRQGKLKDWSYEPETFWFEGIRRGVTSYKPDFKLENMDSTIEYHEVKGYMDSKSKTKIKRMGKYFPHIKLVVVDKDDIKQIKKWERLFGGDK